MELERLRSYCQHVVGARWAWLGLLLLVALVGCTNFPRDPDDTLERVRGSVLRVGVSPQEPWTRLPGPAAEPTGTEPDLVRQFAAELDADIAWTIGGEEELMSELEEGELDLVIGGLTEDTPWTDKAAITQPYTEAPDDTGEMKQHVMATPLGENAFLLALEGFLLERAGS